MRTALVAAALVAATIAAGCGGSSDDTGTAASTAGTEEEAKGVIGVSYPTVEGPWFTAALYGMTDQAQQQGYDIVITSAGGYANIDNQVSQMADLVQQRVSGILTAVADPDALGPQIEMAIEEGIPVIGAGEVVEAATASVTSSHCTLGEEMAEGARELLPDGGTMVALKGPAGAFWTEERWSCFEDALDGSGIEIVAEQASEPSVAEGLRIAEDMLQRFPDVDLIYGVDDTVGVGAAQAVQQGPGCEEVNVVTSILGTEAERMVREGCIDYLVAQQVVKIGRDSVDAAQQAIEGGDVPEIEEIPNVVVTPENIDSVDISTIRQPEGWKPDVG